MNFTAEMKGALTFSFDDFCSFYRNLSAPSADVLTAGGTIRQHRALPSRHAHRAFARVDHTPIIVLSVNQIMFGYVPIAFRHPGILAVPISRDLA